MGRPVPTEIWEFLAPFSDEVQEIALRLRTRVLTVVPHAHETAWHATNAVSFVYSPAVRWQDGIAHIATYASWVNLGFNDGATLADPQGILTGSGSRIRHARFGSPTDTEADWIDAYLYEALAQGGLGAEMGDRGTTVRRSKGPKRRPS